jgi:anti-sigma-K factor RskA
MTHEDLYDDLPLLALGTLDPDERRALEQHLASGCARCQDELKNWHAVVGLLPLAADEADAPDLKPRLLQRLRPAARSAKVIPLRRSWVLPLATAAVLLLAIGTIREVRVQHTMAEQGAELAGMRAKLQAAELNFQRAAVSLADKEKNVAELRTALAAAQGALGVLQSPGLQLVHLTQTPDAQPAEAHALLSPDAQRALFYAFDLPPVAAGKAYELWWITEKEGPVRAGVFLADQNRLARLDSTIPAGVGAIQAAAVTIEPAAGVAKPTGPMVLLGKV